MIWIILILAALILTVLERIWMPLALKALRFAGSCDHIMAEPGETVTWTGTVENHSRLPIPFARLQESFPAESQPVGDPRWIRAHCKRSVYQWYAEERFALRPRQRATRKVSMTFRRRGAYAIGSWRLSAGDILGLREASREGDAQQIVIIPEHAGRQQSLQALGGFLGDISVRRFILEDPILTVGFRDYTGREPMKAISWTRTAAAGTMQVKQYDHTAEQTATVLLNVEGGTPQELEGCFRLARTVCERLEKEKIPFGFRTNGNLPGPVSKLFYLADGLGSQHLSTILYALGRADYTCFRTFRNMVRESLRHRRNNEAYIVITPALTDEVQATLRALESAVGSGLCVLTGRSEVEEA